MQNEYTVTEAASLLKLTRQEISRRLATRPEIPRRLEPNPFVPAKHVIYIPHSSIKLLRNIEDRRGRKKNNEKVKKEKEKA